MAGKIFSVDGANITFIPDTRFGHFLDQRYAIAYYPLGEKEPMLSPIYIACLKKEPHLFAVITYENFAVEEAAVILEDVLLHGECTHRVAPRWDKGVATCRVCGKSWDMAARLEAEVIANYRENFG